MNLCKQHTPIAGRNAHAHLLHPEAKCLGYLWKQNLSSLPMIEDRIQKARKAFFQLGSVYAFEPSVSIRDCTDLCSPYPPVRSGKLGYVL